MIDYKEYNMKTVSLKGRYSKDSSTLTVTDDQYHDVYDIVQTNDIDHCLYCDIPSCICHLVPGCEYHLYKLRTNEVTLIEF